MRNLSSARFLNVLTLTGLVAWTLVVGLGEPLPRGAEIDTAGLASVREIQERLEAQLHQRVVDRQPGVSVPEEPEDDHEAGGAGGSPQDSELRSYIVTLDDQLRSRLEDFAEGTGGEIIHIYDDALTGFSVELVPEAAEALRRVDQVLFVELDQPVEADTQTTPPGVDRVADPGVGSAAISNLGIDGVDAPRVDADIAVLDSGVANHPDLNVAARTDCTETGCDDGEGADRYGHGTHVAGIAAALDNDVGVVGVAPGARIHSVKVLGDNGSGSFRDVIAGLDWAIDRAATIDVINMSLSGEGRLSSLDEAIDNAVHAGIAVVVSAGNNDEDEDDIIPANHPEVLAVSALADSDGVSGGRGGDCFGDDDELADFSNYGRNVDVIAPGACVRSTVPGGYGTKSGTSMSAPLVAGAAALLAANGEDVGAIRDIILDEGNFAWTDTSGDGRKEPLLDVSSSAFTVSGVSAPTTTTSTTTTSTTTPPTTTTSTSTTSTSTTSTSTTSTSTTSTTLASTTTTTVSPGGNQAPVARFTYDCYSSTCVFDGGDSFDSDGSVESYRWDFGDGSQDSGSSVFHAYRSPPQSPVTLTVIDDDGAVASTSHALDCSPVRGRVSCR